MECNVYYLRPDLSAEQNGYVSCEVEKITGKDAGVLNGRFLYPVTMFQRHFHGTLTEFCDDRGFILKEVHALEIIMIYKYSIMRII